MDFKDGLLPTDNNIEINEIAIRPGLSDMYDYASFLISLIFLFAAYPFGKNVSNELFRQIIGGGVATLLGAMFFLYGLHCLKSKRFIRWNNEEIIFSIQFFNYVWDRRVLWRAIEEFRVRVVQQRSFLYWSIVIIMRNGRFVFARGLSESESREIATRLNEVRRNLKEYRESPPNLQGVPLPTSST